eukprot:GHVT01060960.1.p2 GENE.GHVT01060960.1~~GHVT01060960.1.p2  ORF type:complete len:119 (+),score=10.87 GHVT01060960.1:354-710(+)
MKASGKRLVFAAAIFAGFNAVAGQRDSAGPPPGVVAVVPSVRTDSDNLKPVNNFVVGHYAGRWYEQGSSFETLRYTKGCECTQATYSLVEDGSDSVSIKVTDSNHQHHRTLTRHSSAV